jgi:hypothetical protein
MYKGLANAYQATPIVQEQMNPRKKKNLVLDKYLKTFNDY